MRKFFVFLFAIFNLLAVVNFTSAQSAEIGAPIEVKFPEIKPSLPPKNFVPPQAEVKQEINPKQISLFLADLLLSQKETRAGEKISGTFSIKNSSPFDVYNVRYAIFVAQKSRATRPYFLSRETPLSPLSSYIYTLASYRVEDGSINLKTGENLARSFSHDLPKNLVSGDYLVWIVVQPERGQAFLSNEVSLKITGLSKEPLLLSDPVFVMAQGASTAYVPLFNYPTFKENEALQLLYEFDGSPLPGAVVLRPHVEIRKHSVVGPVVKSFDIKEVPLEAGKHSLKISIPTPEPGKYVGLISFYLQPKNSQAKINILPLPQISRFAFVVSGVQAEIQNIFIDHIQNGPSQAAVQIEGPLEVGNDLGEVSVNLKVVDVEQDREVVNTTKTTRLTGYGGQSHLPLLTFDLPSVSSGYFRYTASVLKESKILDEYTVEPQGSPRTTSTPSPSGFGMRYVVAGLIALSILLGMWWYARRSRERSIKISAFLFLFFLASLLFVNSSQAASLVVAPAYLQSFDWWAPAASTYEIGGTINFSVRIYSWGHGNDNGGCVPGMRFWNSTGYAYVVMSDGAPANPAAMPSGSFNQMKTNIEQQFAATNYKVFGPFNTIFWHGFTQSEQNPLRLNCTTWYDGTFSGSVPALDKGETGQPFPTDVRFYLVSFINYAPGEPGFVAYENIKLTPLSYEVSTWPFLRTVAKDQAAQYTASVIPGFASYTNTNPGVPDYLAPHYNPTVFYWDNPPPSGYKPNIDTISFSAGYSSPRLISLGGDECTSIAGWYGPSQAVVVISDREPQNPNQEMRVADIDARFAGANFKKLGPINSSLLIGYNETCTLWFQGRVLDSVVAPASGSGGAFNGDVLAYVVFEGNLGSFTAHQTIQISPTATPGPLNQVSIFTEPVSMNIEWVPGSALGVGFYNLSFVPSDATARSSNNVYGDVTLNITPKDRVETQLVCPPGTIDWGFACWDPTLGDFVPKISQQVTTPPPLGLYKFKVRGISGGAIPGIIRRSQELTLEIVGNQTPGAFDNLRLQNLSCSSVSLSWDPSANQDGYRLIRRDLVNNTAQSFDLPPTQTSYVDSGPSLVSGRYYTYTVEAYNANGSTVSNPLTILIPSNCSFPLTVSCSGAGTGLDIDPITWIATVLSGQPPFSFSWTIAVQDGSGRSVTRQGNPVTSQFDVAKNLGEQPQNVEATVGTSDSLGNFTSASCSAKIRNPRCDDGIDNDGDEKIDLSDLGCSDNNDDDESNFPRLKEILPR